MPEVSAAVILSMNRYAALPDPRVPSKLVRFAIRKFYHRSLFQTVILRKSTEKA
jgi:hypothetical protein